MVDADWRHPAWQGFVRGVAALEVVGKSGGDGDDELLYRRANSERHSDAFMGRPAAAVRPTRAETAAWAARRALAAVSAVEALDGKLPGQPLACSLRKERGWLRARPLSPSEQRTVVFTVRGTHFAATLSQTASLARDLDDLIAGRPGRRFKPVGTAGGEQPPNAAVAVCLDVLRRDEARHAHRLCWGDDGRPGAHRRVGGPWLGVVATPDAELVTTCHMAVDGFGHVLLTDRILPEVQRGGEWSAARLARAGPAPLAGGDDPATGLAWRFLSDGAGRFREQAYATGIALARFYRRGGRALAGRRYSPPFVVPVAPGSRGDPDRRRRRVVHGLISVRRRGHGFESFESFARRLGSWLATERAGQGLLTRTTAAVSRAPLPNRLKRLCLSTHHGARRPVPPIEALSGRACLSSIRVPAGVRPGPPLIAASLSTLLPTADDPRGSVTLTLVHHDEGVTVTAFGTGLAGTNAGAETFLELWLEALAGVVIRLI